MTFSASVKNTSTNLQIVIDDIPTPVTLNPGQQSALIGASFSDVATSLLLRHHDLRGEVEVAINNQVVRLSQLDLVAGGGGGGGGVDSFNSRTGSVVPAPGDYATSVVWRAAESWTDFWTRFSAMQDRPAVVLVEGGAARAISAGTYNTEGVTFVGTARGVGGTWPVVEFEDGAVFQTCISFKNLDIQADAVTTGIFELVADKGAVIILDNCNLAPGPSAAVNLISFSGGGGPTPFSTNHYVILQNQASIGGVDPVVALEYSGSETMNILMSNQSILYPFSITGGDNDPAIFVDGSCFLEDGAVVSPSYNIASQVRIYDALSPATRGTVEYFASLDSINIAQGLKVDGAGYTGTTEISGGAATYNVALSDRRILVNQAEPAVLNIILPDPSAFPGRDLTIKDKKGGAGSSPITLTTDAGTIDGVASLVLDVPYSSIDLHSSGTEWSVLPYDGSKLQILYARALISGIHMEIDLEGLTGLTPLAGDASQDDCNTRAEELRTAMSAHLLGVGTAFVNGEHLAADTAIEATLSAIPSATDIGTCITLINGLHTADIGHGTSPGVHFHDDIAESYNTISVDPPVTLADEIADLNDIRQSMLNHFSAGPAPIPAPNLFATPTLVTASGTYVVKTSDRVVIIKKTAPENSAVTIPAATGSGRFLYVKDGAGDAAVHNITITPVSGVIDGVSSSFVLSSGYSYVLLYDGQPGDWSSMA